MADVPLPMGLLHVRKMARAVVAELEGRIGEIERIVSEAMADRTTGAAKLAAAESELEEHRAAIVPFFELLTRRTADVRDRDLLVDILKHAAARETWVDPDGVAHPLDDDDEARARLAFGEWWVNNTRGQASVAELPLWTAAVGAWRANRGQWPATLRLAVALGVHDLVEGDGEMSRASASMKRNYNQRRNA